LFYSSSQVLKALPVAAPVPAPFREDSRAKFERALDAILTFGGSEKEKEENNNDRRPEIVAAWQEWAVRVPQSDSAMEHWALHCLSKNFCMDGKNATRKTLFRRIL